MAKLADKILAKAGKTRLDMQKRAGKLGQVFRRAGVADSSELKRIINLPRRDWRVGIGGVNGTAEEMIELLTNAWKTPNGTMRLWAPQAVGLAELHDFGGLCGPIRVSGGKTLLSFLAPLAVGAERPLLIVPGNLVRITQRKHRMLSEHWQLPPIKVYSYDLLSRQENKEFLNKYRPDLVVADEAHRFKNLRAACTKVMKWYMDDNPDTIFVPLTGTPTTRSVHDFSHLYEWALPSLCPVPKNYGVLVEFGLCLDEYKSDVRALGPGHLVRLCNDEELELLKTEPLSAVRRAYQRRIGETPGVISLADRGITIPLNIRAFDISIDSPEIDQAFRTLRSKWCTPDGHPFAEAVKLWAHCRELMCGFYYIWDPAPPKPWLRFRQAYYRDIRHILAHNHRRLASELQVASACARGEYDLQSYRDWLAIRDSFKPNNVPVWMHDKTIEFASTWMAENPTGIVWTEHKAFAKRLAEYSGRPYHGSQGLDATGKMIEDADGPIIASVRSNKEGRDLQHKWDKNLIISCAPNGKEFEQLLARTHREGQKSKQVDVDILIGCSEQYYGFKQAIKDAIYQQEIVGHPQKLCFAEIEMPTTDEISKRTATRWKRGVLKNGKT